MIGEDRVTDDFIICLECGKRLRSIGTHLRTANDLSAQEYRERHDLPVRYRLASSDLRAAQSERTRQMIADGSLNNDPLAASEAARHAGRGRRTAADLAEQAERAKRIPHETIPDGGKRADGRDAVRAREAQRRRRATEREKRSGG